MKPSYETIAQYHADGAPKWVCDMIADADHDDILDADYPYRAELKRKAYNKAMKALQIQLVRMQRDLNATGKRVAVIFEGRDAAGKGGTIKRLLMNLNPRSARVVALAKPTELERTQWYFQRYIQHLPSAGQLVCFDRSWYNRAVVEPVFDFATDAQRDVFFDQVPEFEKMLVEDGIILVKFWLTVSRPEQLRRFLARERDPLKQWKLSPIDIQGLALWDDYTAAIKLMYARTHSVFAPWTVLRSDDKRRVQLETIKHVLRQVDYAGKDGSLLEPDPAIFTTF